MSELSSNSFSHDNPAKQSLNIVICTTQVPFVRGGNEVLVDGLARALKEAGHRVAVMALPFKWYPKATLLQQAVLWRSFDLREATGYSVDLVICTKFPTWLVQHPRKVVWLVHQHRQAYDWYGTPLSDFLNTPEDRRARRVIQEMDGKGFLEASKLFAISRNVAARLTRYNNLSATPLYPATKHENFYSGPLGDYILHTSRLDQAKRVDLVLRGFASAASESTVCLVVTGEGPEAANLKTLARSLGIEDRVDFVGYVDEARQIELYANCLAVVYVPIDEDYGYATIEAFKSARAVITCTDSGGVLEFVINEENGLITEPQPVSLGAAFTRLYQDRALAARLGQAGAEKVKLINWQNIVQELLKQE